MSSVKKKRCRKRNTIYFNPPYSAGVKSRVGAQILKLVDDCFPKTNPLYKIFIRHTVKVTYRTTPKMQQLITAHNKKLFSQNKPALAEAASAVMKLKVLFQNTFGLLRIRVSFINYPGKSSIGQTSFLQYQRLVVPAHWKGSTLFAKKKHTPKHWVWGQMHTQEIPETFNCKMKN